MKTHHFSMHLAASKRIKRESSQVDQRKVSRGLKLLDVEGALVALLVINPMARFCTVSPPPCTQHVFQQWAIVDFAERFLEFVSWEIKARIKEKNGMTFHDVRPY